jgi:hypothetical protein
LDPTGKVVRARWRGVEYTTVEAAQAAVDRLFGPDLITPAIEKYKAEGYTLTQRQERQLHSLCRDILENDGLGVRHMASYEYKELRLDPMDSKNVFLTTTVGRKGDENTLGSVIARSHRMALVGRMGGVKSFYGPKSKRTGYSNFIIFGKEN